MKELSDRDVADAERPLIPVRAPIRSLACSLLISMACDRVEDVCSGLDEATCPADTCVFEVGSGACLQRCDDDGRCPGGLTCAEDSLVDSCDPGGGCLGDALTADVCRSE